MSDTVLQQVPVFVLRDAVLFPAQLRREAVPPSAFPLVEVAAARGVVFVVRQVRSRAGPVQLDDLAAIGVLASVQVVARSTVSRELELRGLARARLEALVQDPVPEVQVRPVADASRGLAEGLEVADATVALLRKAEALVCEQPDLPFAARALVRLLAKNGTPVSLAADLVAATFVSAAEQPLFLETLDVGERVVRLHRHLEADLDSTRRSPWTVARAARWLRCTVGL